MDPIVGTLVTSFVSSIFTPPAAAAVPPSAAGGVSAAQLQSILDAQRADSARRTALLLGLGLAAAGVIAALVISRR